MTTYLGTRYDTNEEVTRAFCSEKCARDFVNFHFRVNLKVPIMLTVERYEFDETCSNCGAHVPASAQWFDYDPPQFTPGEMVDRLADRYDVGVKQ